MIHHVLCPGASLVWLPSLAVKRDIAPSVFREVLQVSLEAQVRGRAV